jgi:hypothetical protein
MLIELHIRRTRNGVGSTISFPGGVSYEFKPRPDLTGGDGEAHVCEVDDEAHVSRLLSIREYTEYGEDMASLVKEPVPKLVEIPDEPSKEDELQEEEDLEIEMQMCETVVGMKVSEAKEQLPGLSDKALSQLATMERAGQARKSLLEAITQELESRAEGSDDTE